MGNVYYGVCETAASEPIKVVQFLSTAEIETVSALEIGDLFAVYFANQNTVDSITITTDEDLSSDAGLTVKTLGEQEQCANLWENGEAVIFVCTSINENSEVAPTEEGADENPQSDFVYLRLFNSGQASVDVSGIMKLLTKEPIVDVGTYLTTHENDEAAVAPWILKELYDLIGTRADVTYAVDIREPQVSDTWYPNIQLGILTVNDTDEYQILAPPQTVYTRTSQFENDGEENNPPAPSRDTSRGGKYITSILPTPLYFTGVQPTIPTTDGIPVYLYKQTENADYPILGNDVISSGGTTTSTTQVFGDVIKLGGCVTVNNDSQSPTINLPTTSIGGNTNITGGLAVSSNISEAGTLLKNKYSGKLIVTTHKLTLDTTNNTTQITVAKNSLSGHKFPVVNLSDRIETLLGPVETGANYQCLGIVGHNYDYYDSNSQVDSSYVLEWELFPSSLGINTATIGFDIRNLNTQKSIVFTLRVNLLWVKVVN